jgi:hypothetical protein
MNKKTEKEFREYIKELYYLKLLIGYQADQSDGARYENFEQWFADQDLKDLVFDCDGDYHADLLEFQNGECCHSDMDDGHCLDCGLDRSEELMEAAIARAESAAEAAWEEKTGR